MTNAESREFCVEKPRFFSLVENSARNELRLNCCTKETGFGIGGEPRI